MITISTNAVALLLTLLIPVAVAAVTKATLPSSWKAVLTIILSGLVILITRARQDNGTAILTTQVAFDWAVTTAIAIASYLGVWRPVTQINANIAPKVGIGPANP